MPEGAIPVGNSRRGVRRLRWRQLQRTALAGSFTIKCTRQWGAMPEKANRRDPVLRPLDPSEEIIRILRTRDGSAVRRRHSRFAAVRLRAYLHAIASGARPFRPIDDVLVTQQGARGPVVRTPTAVSG